jgi:GNAT superfamily N-acetyltransferase
MVSCLYIMASMPRDGAGRKSMSLPFSISDLRQQPGFLDTVADRIWRAWWRDSGYPLDYVSARLRDENLNADPIPFALVAHDGMKFPGTSSVIKADLAERPQLTPWVAAVWVDPQARQRGVGAALVNRAAQDCRAGRQPRLSVRTAPAFGLLRKTGLDLDRARCRTPTHGRFDPGRNCRTRPDQPFAAMKIDRPKPVR